MPFVTPCHSILLSLNNCLSDNYIVVSFTVLQLNTAHDPVLKSVPQTSNNFFPLQTIELLFFHYLGNRKWAHDYGLAHKFKIQHIMTSDCKTAILKGTAVCSLRCHLGMLQILLKKASWSPYTESNITPHISGTKTA